MTDPTIFVCRPSAISNASKAELKRAGVITVEMEDPAQFKLIRASSELQSSDLFALALDALASQPQNTNNSPSTATYQRERFVRLMAELANAEAARRAAQRGKP